MCGHCILVLVGCKVFTPRFFLFFLPTKDVLYHSGRGDYEASDMSTFVG